MTNSTIVRGVVLSGTGGIWQVRTENGDTVEASLRGRLKKSNSGRRADGSLRRDTISSAAQTLKLAVGDDVHLECADPAGDWAIAEILPRRSKLARRSPGGGHGERVLAANVDQVVVMFAAAKPDPHPRMMDRFLVIAEANDIGARIIINKVELVGEAAARCVRARRLSRPLHECEGGDRSRVRARDASRTTLSSHRTIWRREIVAAQCAVPRRRSSRRRDQRIRQQGTTHDSWCTDAPASWR